MVFARVLVASTGGKNKQINYHSLVNLNHPLVSIALEMPVLIGLELSSHRMNASPNFFRQYFLYFCVDTRNLQ